MCGLVAPNLIIRIIRIIVIVIVIIIIRIIKLKIIIIVMNIFAYNVQVVRFGSTNDS